MQNYIEQALRTKSEQFHVDMVDHWHLHDMLLHFVSVSNELDKIKKALFYGKRDGSSGVVGVPLLLLAGLKPDILHGLLGKITETGELAQCVLATFKGVEFDPVNMAEELGDSQWYDAIMAKALGLTFEQLQQMNIAKLQARFPEKFTEELAEVRNLDEERNILESQQKMFDTE